MLYPLVFDPILVPKPWGGRRLAHYGKQLTMGETTGESWELSDLRSGEATTVSAGESQVANGPLAGRTIGGLIDEFGEALLGPDNSSGRLPLLVKLIDAQEPLSVQVHPTAAYAADHPEVNLKTESWYVVEAEPGAVIYRGLAPGTTLAELGRTAATPEVVELLDVVPVQAGDFHHLPAGTVHALGAGVLVAEIQTPSDTTFRIYDWTDEYGRQPRPLQVAEALACVETTPAPSTDPYQLDLTTRSLVDTDDYWIHEHRSDAGPLGLDPQPGLRVVMVVDGCLSVGDVVAPRGTTVLIPASVRTVAESFEPVVVLEIGLAAPGVPLR